jgi:hypothetical protein
VDDAAGHCLVRVAGEQGRVRHRGAR